MKMTPLGRTGLNVSVLCLGSMTWGSQSTEAEGHAQIDMALDHGVNFIDTAEMYPTNPVRAETVGGTETIIGNWLERSGRRSEVILASKVTGSGSAMVREGARVTPETFVQALDGSLARLRTDYIDIYQLHWPTRGSYHFRQGWNYDPSSQSKAEVEADMQTILEAAQAAIEAGKIGHFALSNETAWGTAQWLRLSEEAGLPRIASIQNEYSLLCRLADTDLAELCHNEDLPILAYSPLGAGLLSGKYAGDVTPAGSRRSHSPELGGRVTPRVFAAVDAYAEIAGAHGLDLVQMAIAWTLTRPFPMIPIIGATTTAQLSTILGAADLTLSEEVRAAIEAAHRAHPMPF